jgi:hypothetical protein
MVQVIEKGKTAAVFVEPVQVGGWVGAEDKRCTCTHMPCEG